MPDRSDRPEFFAFAVKQVNRMGFGEAAYIINDRPQGDEIDIVPRIKRGIEMAKRDGFDFVLLIENDDYYPEEYLLHLQDYWNYDFVGFSATTYYHLKNKTWQNMRHPNRSSLFCTGFRISALSNNFWNRVKDNTKFLDILIWEEAQRTSDKIKLLDSNSCIGIKHGIGKTGGRGHHMTFQYSDPEMKWLKEHVDKEAFEFYRELSKKL